MSTILRAITVFICICCLLPVPTWSQQTQTASEETIEPLSYAMEVELTQISVRVTDKSGKWIGGLSKNDLEVREDGVPQEIRYVDEITEATQQPQVPSRKPDRKEFTVTSVYPNSIIVIFDTSTSGQVGIQQHRKYVQDFLNSYQVPNSIFALIVIKPTGDYEITANFTDDKNRIVSAIEQVRGSSGGFADKLSKTSQLSDVNQIEQCTAMRGEVGKETCFEQALGGIVRKADSFAQQEQTRAVNTVNSLKKIFALCEHVPGRKNVLLVSEGLDPSGGYYYNFGANVIRYWMEHYGVPPRYETIYVNEIKTDAARSISNIQKVGDLVKSANASGLPVYWANPEFGKSAGDISTEISVTSSLDLKLVNAPDVESTMRGLAEDTGGAALASRNPKDFYNKLKEVIPRYYLISYRPKRAMNDGRFHRTEVFTKNKDYKVAYAKEFKDFPLKERIQSELASAHDFPGVAARFPVQLEVSYFKRSGGDYQTMLRSAISYKDIDPQIIENRSVDDIHFSFLIRNKDKVIFNTHPILKLRSPLQEFQNLSNNKASLEFVQNTVLKPGTYQVSLAVMDVTGWKSASNTTFVDLPGPAASCLSVSPLMLASSASKNDKVIKDPTPTEKGQIAFGENLFSFSLQRLFPAKGNLNGFYQIYNAGGSAPSVMVSFKLFRDKTVFMNQTPEQQLKAYTDPLQKLISNFYSVPYNNLAPGSYELEIVARDANTGCKASARAPFEIAGGSAGTATPSLQ